MTWVLVVLYVVGLLVMVGYGSYKRSPETTWKEDYDMTLAAVLWPLALVLVIPMWIGSSLQKRQEHD